MTAQAFHSLCDRVARVAIFLAVAGLVAMVATIIWQVFGRFVLNDSPSWTEPLALLLMLYFVLLAAAVGVREGSHMGLEILSTQGNSLRARVVHVTVHALIAVFGLLMAIEGMNLLEFTATHEIPGLGISRGWAYVPFALAGSLICLFALERLVTAAGAGAPANVSAAE